MEEPQLSKAFAALTNPSKGTRRLVMFAEGTSTNHDHVRPLLTSFTVRRKSAAGAYPKARKLLSAM